jgi:hypothetical protein
MYVVYANAHSVCEHASYVAACVIFLYVKIFVCFITQPRLLAIISKFVGGGGLKKISALLCGERRRKFVLQD